MAKNKSFKSKINYPLWVGFFVFMFFVLLTFIQDLRIEQLKSIQDVLIQMKNNK